MTRGRIIGVSIGILATVAVVVLGVIYVRTTTTKTLVWQPEVGGIDRWTRSVTLYFGDPRSIGLVPETREVIDDAEEEAAIRRLLDEQLRGSERGNLSLLEARCRVRTVFLDRQRAVVDFRGSPFPTGAGETTCRMGLESLCRVLLERLPTLREVSFLVDGSPMGESEPRLAVPTSFDPRGVVREERVHG
jgi:hypothetical protein